MADILYNFENIPSGKLAHTEFFDDGDTVSEVEISRALLTLTEGVQYMNNVQRRFHMNINPESIVITANGQWKLCGFGFSLSYQQGDQQRIPSPYFLKQVTPTASGSLIRLEPDVRYIAPECSEGGYNPPSIRFITPSADLFSLAVTLYEVYKFNLASSPWERSSFKPIIAVMNNDIQHHNASVEILKNVDVSFLPTGINQLMHGLLNLNVQYRKTAMDVTSSQYFITGTMGVLYSIENLHTRDLGTQTSQLMSFQNQLDRFPPRLLKFIVLPSIGKLCVTLPTLWEYALPVFQLISRLVQKEVYQAIAGPYLAAGLSVNSCNESMLAFLAFVPCLIETFDPLYFSVSELTNITLSLFTLHFVICLDECDSVTRQFD